MNEYLFNKEQYLKIKQAWKNLPTRTARDVVIYNFLRSKPLDRGFSATSYQIAGSNWYAWKTMIAALHFELHRSAVSTMPEVVERRKRIADQNLKKISERFGIELTEEHAEKFLSELSQARAEHV